jgi:uncharacterized phage protein (TIGR01671 family)
MSREIKFRAWVKMYDDSDGVMLNMPMNIHHFDFEDGIVISFTDYPEFYGHENYDHRNPKLPHEINIMQYTGLKDKNGKEIYEGDILRINHGDNIDELEYYSDGDTYQVIFKDCCYWGKCIYTLRPSTTPLETLLSDLDYWEPQSKEIIGNIYKNPELITEVKNG